MQAMTLGDLIRLNAANLPDELALITATERLTYAALNRRVNRVAAALGAAGIGRGDRVAVLGRNSIHYVCLYFGLAKIGAMLVPMNFWHRAGEHRYVLENSEPALIFHEPEFTAVIAEANAGLPTRLLQMPPADAPPTPDWEQFTAGAADTEPAVRPEADWPHMILYTSGTTGRPKGALLSHGRTVDDAFGMAASLRIRQTDVFVNFFPPFHVGNWDHQKLFLLVGARVVLMTEFDAGAVLAAIERERVSVLLGVPTMLHALLNHASFAATDVSSIRLVYYGAYDPNGILERTAELLGAREGRIEMTHTYGLTEAGPFVLLCPPDELMSHWGSVGRAVPGVEVALLDDAGQPVPAGTPGEICMRGPRMSGYWRNPEATAEALRDGWLHTGDIGTADARGFVWIIDRKKDMIRTGGQNVYSKEVEDCISAHPDVADVAVIGLDDPVYEEAVCAIVVLRDGIEGTPALAEVISAFVRARRAGYNAPKQVIFVDALPKNAVGKVEKHVLRRQYRGA